MAAFINAAPLFIATSGAAFRFRRAFRSFAASPLRRWLGVAPVITKAAVVAKWGATPGQRLMGLRVVDATTGGPVSFRQAMVWDIMRRGPSLLFGAIPRRRTTPTEMSEFYRQVRLPNPWKACLDARALVAIAYAVALYRPALGSSRRQCVHDRLANVAVIAVE